VGTVANLLKQSLKMSLPMVIRRDQRHIFESVVMGESVVLFLNIKFEVSQQAIEGYVALIMDLPSIEQLRTLIANFLTSLGPD
jgi:chemotaxis protein CheC